MNHGAEWYKREPVAYLGGVQGMTAKEHAVYGIILDLVYQHGGSVNDDPAWFAGWISDMGSSAVRKVIESLIDRGKLTREGDQLTNKRAKTQAKTKENLSETRAKHGRNGGISSGKSRSLDCQNNDLVEATDSPREDKRREEKNIPPKSPKGDGVLEELRKVLSEGAAIDFIAHRAAKKSKLTLRAAELIVAKLQGHSSPDTVIFRSIENGWTGIFPEDARAKPSNLQSSSVSDQHRKWEKLAAIGSKQ